MALPESLAADLERVATDDPGYSALDWSAATTGAQATPPLSALALALKTNTHLKTIDLRGVPSPHVIRHA